MKRSANVKRFLKFAVPHWAEQKRWFVRSKGNGVNQHVLAILSADLQVDLSLLASNIGGLRASLASLAEVDALTGCVFGAIPPFSFHPKLKLVADPLLFERFNEIAFNAGEAENPRIMDTADDLRIANRNSPAPPRTIADKVRCKA